MRIKAVVACLVAIALPGLLSAAWLGLQNWQSWRHERAELTAVQAVGSLLRAQGALDEAAHQRLSALLGTAMRDSGGPAIAIARQIMDVNDHAARRAAILGRWLRGEPMTPGDLAAADAATGSITQAWNTAQRLIAAAPEAATLRQEAILQTSPFWQQDEPWVRRMLDAWRGHAAVPGAESRQAFDAWTIPALDPLLTLRDAALRAAATAHTDAARAAALRCCAALSLVVAAAVLAMTAALMLRRKMLDPLQTMTGAITRIAAAGMPTPIPGQDPSDAPGAMAGGLQTLQGSAGDARKNGQDGQHQDAGHQTALAALRQEMEAARRDSALVVDAIGYGLQRLAAGNPAFRLDQPLPAPYEPLRHDLNAALTQFQAVLRQLAGSSAALRASTRTVTHAADALARRTERQAVTLEQTASASSQATRTMRMTAQAVLAAREMVGRTRADAEDAALAVRTAARTMAAIDAASRKMQPVLGDIREFAYQINQRALSAGIEAARTGAAGSPFATAAAEMRAMAQGCSAAAHESAALMTVTSGHMALGMRLVDEAGLTLERVLARIAEVTAAVAGIAAAAQGQAAALHGAPGGIGPLTRPAPLPGQDGAAPHAPAQEAAQLIALANHGPAGEDPAGP